MISITQNVSIPWSCHSPLMTQITITHPASGLQRPHNSLKRNPNPRINKRREKRKGISVVNVKTRQMYSLRVTHVPHSLQLTLAAYRLPSSTDPIENHDTKPNGVSSLYPNRPSKTSAAAPGITLDNPTKNDI